MNLLAITMEQWLRQRYLNNTVEQWLWFVGIILGAFILRVFFSRILARLLFRFFKKSDPDHYKTALSNFKSFVLRPLQAFLLWVAVFVAYKFLKIPRTVRIFEEETLLLRYALNTLFEIILILSFTWLLMRIVNYVAYLWTRKSERDELRFDPQLIPFFKDATKVVLFILGGLVIVGFVFNKDVTALIGGLGIGGLAIALAAQETLSNLLGSVTIFLDKPFRTGDLIDLGSGLQGTVERVGIRSTRLRTLDKSYVTVPNKDLVNKMLNNITQSTHRRAKFTLHLVYGTQPDQLRLIIAEIRQLLDAHEKVAEDYVVRFFEFGESSLNILVAYLVITNDYDEYVEVRESLNYQIYEVVVRNGSSFAYPTRTVLLEGEGKGSPTL